MVSIIIPVYNAGASLNICLDSILEQTYKDYEVILINDGSTDNSQKVIDEYKKLYPDIFRVYTQKNKGVAITRNRGVDYSKGKYIFFIDNDDYIEKDYIKKFVMAIEGKEIDMVVGGYRRVENNGRVIFKREATDDPWIKYMIVAPWGRVYRADTLKESEIRFLESNIWEDVYFNILVNFKLRVSTIDYNGYYWVYNPSSVSNTKQKKLNPFVDLTKVFDKIKEDVDKIAIPRQEKEYFEYFFIKASIWYLLHSGKGVEFSLLKQEYFKLFSWLEKNYPDYAKNKQIGLFTPKGEAFSVRTIVTAFLLLKKIHLETIFLHFYSKK